MPRKRTPADAAAGKLILELQRAAARHWDSLEKHYFADAVVSRAHDIHQAIIGKRLPEALGSRTIRQYLDAGWVLDEPGVQVALQHLESALDV